MTASAELKNRVLVFGYGNPGRQDDGLGPALIEALEQDPPSGVQLESDYQLSVENAWDLSRHPQVILVDATVDGDAPFYFQPLSASATMSFSTHSVSPGAVLQLARTLFQAEPQVYLLGIRGYQFAHIAEGLTPQAAENCRAAERFLRSFLADAGVTT
ncbi:hydrogenase maturation protease [Motiliproteus sediminis]|uniref:hydrogenase maturation protease n=1 Tax=Motiliproteus sediminis TaxID=1468178 RepID=UPI001AEFF93F|nr:hydrogenase maturation protease [Motiliproteus sediminis]